MKSGAFYEAYCKKSTLYIARHHKNGKYINSAPCKDCLDFIKKSKVKKIVFANNENIFVQTKPENFDTNHYSCGSMNKLEI
jgi:hypothetical protein